MGVTYIGGSCGNCDCEMVASVVMPCFNAGPFLDEQLAALAEQDTPGPWELVISDNGSRDGSIEIAKRAAHRFHRMVILDSSSRPGAAFARNVGAEAARSNNLLFCDADDVVDRFWVHELLRALERDRLVAGRIETAALNDGVPRFGRSGGIQEVDTPTFFGGMRYALTCNMGIARADFTRVGGFDTQNFCGAAGEDVDFAVRAAREGLVPRFVAEALVHYRIRGSRTDALRQARSYGVTSAELLLRNDELPLVTVADDVQRYWSLGVKTLRSWVTGQEARPTWNLSYEFAKTRRLARDPRYWVPRRNYHYPRSRGSIRGQALRKGLLRIATHLQVEGGPHEDADARTYGVLRDAQANLGREHRHTLGLGLLADAQVTLELDRPPHRWYTHAAADQIVIDLIERGAYSGEELAAVTEFARNRRPTCRYAINVGANIGTSAIPLYEAGWEVVAIEPAPRAASLLRRNLRQNGDEDRATVFEAAVAETGGEATMVIGHNLSISELLGENSVAQLAGVADLGTDLHTVQTARLDELMKRAGIAGEDVALVWSDTEGSEASVIGTGVDLWAAGVPLWVEIRPFALIGHVRLTDFCALVEQHFTSFATLKGLQNGSARPTAELRRFIDELGRERWTFTNVMLHN